MTSIGTPTGEPDLFSKFRNRSSPNLFERDSSSPNYVSEREAASIIKGLTLAVESIHSSGFVHGNLDPFHICFEDGQLKLIPSNLNQNITKELARFDIFCIGIVMNWVLFSSSPSLFRHSKPAAGREISKEGSQLISRLLQPIYLNNLSLKDILNDSWLKNQDSRSFQKINSNISSQELKLKLDAVMNIGRIESLPIPESKMVEISRIVKLEEKQLRDLINSKGMNTSHCKSKEDLLEVARAMFYNMSLLEQKSQVQNNDPTPSEIERGINRACKIDSTYVATLFVCFFFYFSS